LVSAADRGDSAAIDAVWQSWLHRPDDERWELLVRWRTAQEATDGLLAAATDPGRPAAARALLGAFCVRHDIAPADPVARAVFFLLTGQPSQYRAADPDGSLLTLGYAGATSAHRTALAAAMAGTGGPDLVRVVLRGDPRDRLAGLTSAEGRHLAEQLARRRDWTELWQLTRELRVLDAVRAMPLFEAGWRPDADRDRVLFAALSRADPARLDRADTVLRDRTAPGVPGLDGTRMTRIGIRGLPRVALHAGALSAGGKRLAMVSHEGGNPMKASVLTALAVPELVPGSTRREVHHIDCKPSHILPAFDGDILYLSHLTADPGSPAALTWYANGQQRGFAALGSDLPRTHIVGLAPRVAPGGGLLILCRDRLLTWDRDHAVRANSVWVSDLPGGVQPVSLFGMLPHCLATGPGGRAAIAVPGMLRVFDVGDPDQTSLVATQRLESGTAAEASFCAEDQIVTIVHAKYTGNEKHDLRLWRLDGDRLELMAARHMPFSTTPVVIPGHDLLAIWHGSQVCYYDRRTLADADPPPGFANRGVRGLWNSPDLRACALASTDHVQVYDGVPADDTFPDRSPAGWVPADLPIAAAAAAAMPPGSVLRPLFDVLLACLEYRFGADIEVGTTAVPPSAPDDIALSSGG
jgi:hypothetical protein